MEIMRASQQWSTRPADERFWTVSDLHKATLAHRECAQTSTVDMQSTRVEAVDGEIQLTGRTGATAQLTHWAFGQLAARAMAPAGYLRGLPATLAVQNINHGLKQRMENGGSEAQLLLHKNGGFLVRAITTDYARIWNYSITERLLALESEGWRVPPARPVKVVESFEPSYLISHNLRLATAEDAALSLSVQEGDPIGPAGLYASFEDMFAFMLHPERVIRDGSEGGLIRGFLCWNSEVGKSRFGIQTFYFRGVCGNHIIWGAEEVKEVSVVHRGGKAEEKAFDGLEITLKKYAEESSTDIEEKIKYARKFVLKSKTKEDVLDFVFGMRILTRKDAVRAYDAVVEDEDGPAYTAYGFAQGITRVSQEERNADTRVALDRAAGKVLQVAF